jgi:hypothetical protein
MSRSPFAGGGNSSSAACTTRRITRIWSLLLRQAGLNLDPIDNAIAESCRLPFSPIMTTALAAARGISQTGHGGMAFR